MDIEENTIGLNFIPTVLSRKACATHNAPKGIPCFHIHKLDGGYGAAVCNVRAKRTGFNARINPSSLRKKPVTN